MDELVAERMSLDFANQDLVGLTLADVEIDDRVLDRDRVHELLQPVRVHTQRDRFLTVTYKTAGILPRDRGERRLSGPFSGAGADGR